MDFKIIAVNNCFSKIIGNYSQPLLVLQGFWSFIVICGIAYSLLQVICLVSTLANRFLIMLLCCCKFYNIIKRLRL